MLPDHRCDASATLERRSSMPRSVTAGAKQVCCRRVHPPIGVQLTAVCAHAAAATLAELLIDGGNGDPAKLAQLHRQTSALVHHAAMRVLHDHHLAADVTQEVYLQIWEGQARYERGTGPAIPWLLTIARRRAVDRVRNTATRTRHELRHARAEPAQPADPVSDEVIAALTATVLHQALAELTDAQHTTITSAYLDGHSYPEVAALLGIPLATVKSRIRDGMRKLRPALVDPTSDTR